MSCLTILYCCLHRLRRLTLHGMGKLWLGLCLGAVLHTPVWAQIAPPVAVDLAQASSPLQADERDLARLPMLALQGLGAQSTAAQAKNATAYVAFEPDAIYQLSGDAALWLKLKVKTDPLSDRRWTLVFTKTFLDRIELHYQDAQGQWQKQQAGDAIAHSQWSQRTLAPQLRVPALPAGEHDLLIKIVQEFPQQIPVALMLDGAAAELNQNDTLVAAAVMGLLGLVLLLALHLAYSYRDSVYTWYAIYVLFSLLSIATYLGIASYLFWPQADKWPEASTLVLILISVAAQLWFCQAMFMRDMQSVVLKRAAQCVVAFSILLALSNLLVVSASYRITAFTLGLALCIGCIIVIVGKAAVNKLPSAYFWLAAYMPLIVSVVIALLDNLSFISPVGLPYSLPAYTLAFEAMVLLFALHLHAKNRHAVQERERALTATDPLTGFLNASVFAQRLSAMWGRAVAGNKDLALVMVYVHHNSDKSDPQSALRLERKLLRSVRLLHTITRDVDAIARVGGNVLSVAMPGIPMGDDLNNRLARLIALGLMLDPYDTEPMELHFRITAGTRGMWGDDLKSLDNHLRAAIAQTSGWSRKPIQYITAQSSAVPVPLPAQRPSATKALVGTVHRSSDGYSDGDPAALNTSLRSSGANTSAPPSSSI
jgi:two-component system, sensor histidine kinase LadS